MISSRLKNWDVMPEMSLGYGDNIEVVDEIKIVGYIFRSDMKTKSNTSYIIKKAYKRMWLLRRLKTLGASRSQLIDVMNKQVLSVMSIHITCSIPK